MLQDYSLTYQLPAGISCDGGCVLQWRYFAMQSCVVRGCNPTYCGAYAAGTNAVYGGQPGFCGDPGVAAAEFFLNCAGGLSAPLSPRVDMGLGRRV